ncbi:MAG: hypothetical protein ABL876_13465 [Chitinophagaceae bacterium]
MSSVQNKLLSIELSPPPGVWEKIAAELDDSASEHQFPSRLYQHEVSPPAGVWGKISSSLDAIVPKPTVAEKLLALEVAPPAFAWNKIKVSLDAEHEAALPEHRRMAPLLRYAAAAVLVGLLAWGGIKLLNTKPKEEESVAIKHETEIPEKGNIPVVTNDPVAINENSTGLHKTAIAASDEARDDAALEASKKTYARLDITSNSKIKEAANFYFGEPISSGNTRGLDYGDDDYTDNVLPPVKDPNRYIILMTPDGNIIRMSRKLGNLICCVSGEEQDADCIDQMKKWREKMASPSAVHSPGNFMDILNLLNSLQDDNNN